MSVADLRKEYMLNGLSEADVDADPIRQFRVWFDQALAAGLAEPNAMTVATSTPDGRPSARMLLIKGVDERGFVFYTNYESRKGQELAGNPYAALVFYWAELERQVRIEGAVEQVTRQLTLCLLFRTPGFIDVRTLCFITPHQALAGHDLQQFEDCGVAGRMRVAQRFMHVANRGRPASPQHAQDVEFGGGGSRRAGL